MNGNLILKIVFLIYKYKEILKRMVLLLLYIDCDWPNFRIPWNSLPRLFRNWRVYPRVDACYSNQGDLNVTLRLSRGEYTILWGAVGQSLSIELLGFAKSVKVSMRRVFLFHVLVNKSWREESTINIEEKKVPICHVHFYEMYFWRKKFNKSNVFLFL